MIFYLLHSSLHCVFNTLFFNYITISCIYLFLTPNSRSVFRAGVSLNIHSFFHICFLPGYDMTLSAPLNLMMGVEAILNCTIKYAKGMEDEVQFVSKVNPNITYSVRQYSDSCKTQPSSDPRFKAVCGENTNDTYSPVKVYSLIITETRMVDRTLWYCHLWNAKSYSPPALLSIRGEYMIIFRWVLCWIITSWSCEGQDGMAYQNAEFPHSSWALTYIINWFLS